MTKTENVIRSLSGAQPGAPASKCGPGPGFIEDTICIKATQTVWGKLGLSSLEFLVGTIESRAGGMEGSGGPQGP